MKKNTDTLRPSDLVLSSYGSPLRKPVIGWLLHGRPVDADPVVRAWRQELGQLRA